MILKRLATIEALLIQVIFYLLLWLWDDYLASIISLILGGISFSVLIISYLVELVERSRVSKDYYRVMFFCFLAPVLGAIIGIVLLNGLSWLE